MILKIVSLFLVVMAVLGMFGKLRVPKILRRDSRRCPACGRFRIGKGPCSCGREGRG